MISLAQAWERIQQTVTPAEIQSVPLTAALGCVLAGDVRSSVDSPPFDKSMMDGFGVRAADLNAGRRTLAIVGELTAGEVNDCEIQVGEAIRIMTGAKISPGVDAVVPVEDTQVLGDVVHVLRASPVAYGHNIVRRGTSMRTGDALLPAGRRLRPQEIGLLAELGCNFVLVRRPPSMAALATGNELVPVDKIPGPGQIRNSNGPMLTAQIQAAGCHAIPLGIARDERNALRRLIEQGLQADILCLSGGVSAGMLDLVPDELRQAGVQEVFHQVAMKPGKPVWFGVRPGERPCYVFGLPGNPVSSQVCFELFVRAAIRCWLGEQAVPQHLVAELLAPFISNSDRPTYFPARLTHSGCRLQVAPTNWQGSFDLRATVDANALAYFDQPRYFAPGAEVAVLPLGPLLFGT